MFLFQVVMHVLFIWMILNSAEVGIFILLNGFIFCKFRLKHTPKKCTLLLCRQIQYILQLNNCRMILSLKITSEAHFVMCWLHVCHVHTIFSLLWTSSMRCVRMNIVNSPLCVTNHASASHLCRWTFLAGSLLSCILSTMS